MTRTRIGKHPFHSHCKAGGGADGRTLHPMKGSSAKIKPQVYLVDALMIYLFVTLYNTVVYKN